jgi:RHS repeat-associated protein
VRNFTLDANGSTTANGLSTYAYDARGRMIGATSSIGTTTYQVNALGQRVRKTNSLTDLVFHYDTMGHLIAESTPAGTMLREYIWVGDTPLAIASSAGTYFMHADHLNTPRIVFSQSGEAAWRWDQEEPFGLNVANENPSGLGNFDLPIRLPGQYLDKETNLHYNFYRDYDPSVGRYGESDPIGLRGGLNTYVYVFSVPLGIIDPNGLQSIGGPASSSSSFKPLPVLPPGPMNRQPWESGYMLPLTLPCYWDCFFSRYPVCFAAATGTTALIGALTGGSGVPMVVTGQVVSGSCSIAYLNTTCNAKCFTPMGKCTAPYPDLAPSAVPGDVMMYQ